MTLALFPTPATPPRPTFLSTPVIKSNVLRPLGPGTIALPARRLHRSTAEPREDRRERELRAYTNGQTQDAVIAVLQGVEDAPWALAAPERDYLMGLFVKPCRVHRGVSDELCPGEPECGARLEDYPHGAQCDHTCPGSPECCGSTGRFLACDHVRAHEERNCERLDGVRRAFVKTTSCHTPGCAWCEPQRQAKVALRYGAAIDQEHPKDVVLAVFTGLNVPVTELRRGLRDQHRAIAKLARTPLFTGSRPCEARTLEDGPFHPCAHAAHRWECLVRPCCCKKHSKRRRRSCRPCPHPSCRPNCPTYRHRGVAAALFSDEIPISTRTAGTWNVHTNAILALRTRCDDHPKGCPPNCPTANHVGWLAPFEEVSWYWARATCPHHRRRRCPGRPICSGGAWDVDLKGYDPKKRSIREYLKYVTKAAEVVEHGGPKALVEFLLVRRRARLLRTAGRFYGTKFQVPKDEQAAADEETVAVWVSDTRKERFPKRCPWGAHDADWDGDATRVSRLAVSLVSGVECATLRDRPPGGSP